MTNSTPLQTAVLAGGCFWCLEAAFQEIKGVASVVPGYAGGQRANPTYEQVSTGATGHAEAVQVEFDPATLSYTDLLDIFWIIHNPTTKDRQGNDVGSQYRSVIFYAGDAQKQEAQRSIEAVAKLWDDPIVTELVPLEQFPFYEAEAYHHNYYRNHPDQAYCQIVINPKLAKLREKFAARLKPS